MYLSPMNVVLSKPFRFKRKRKDLKTEFSKTFKTFQTLGELRIDSLNLKVSDINKSRDTSLEESKFFITPELTERTNEE
mgnify:CR=1 FL=1